MYMPTCMQTKWDNLGIWYYTDESFCPWDCEICHRCTFGFFSPLSQQDKIHSWDEETGLVMMISLNHVACLN